MAYVILGLLLIRPMSQYDLVKAFESGVSLFYGASAGSIRRALDQLLERGDVEVLRVEPGRGRKVYGPTGAGRHSFGVWMRSRPERDVEREALARLYFLGLLPAAERSGVAAHLREAIARELAVLEALAQEIATVTVPEELADVARYQRATLEYGLASTRQALAWFEELDLGHDEGRR